MAGSAETLWDDSNKPKEPFEGTVDADKLKPKFDVSHFGANAVLRGMQLTLVGGT